MKVLYHVPEALGQINMTLKLVDLKMLAAGLYSPQQIDIARIAAVMESGSNISNLDICLLILVKSGLPGFLVEPAVGKFHGRAGILCGNPDNKH